MKFLAFFTMLIVMVLSDPLQTIYNIINIPLGSKINRVTKLQEITFTHSLTTSTSTWLEYAGLTMVVKIPFDQFVPVYYTILIHSSASCWMSTRLMIDNKEVKLMAAGTVNVWLHDHRGYNEVFLSKGDHSIRIDYRTDCNFNNIGIPDIAAVSVRADYL